MPRRYAPDGTPLFSGKRPEDFTESDIKQFLDDTKTHLSKKEHLNMSDEKTSLPQEVEQAAALPFKLDVTARPIEPMGNLVGFASIKFNDAFVVEDFKILNSDKGLFVGMPSKPDKSSRTGYRDTAKPITKEFRAELTGAVVTAYHAEVEKLQARAAAIPPPEKESIPKQLEKAAKQAAKDNAARPAPEKSNKGKNER